MSEQKTELNITKKDILGIVDKISGSVKQGEEIYTIEEIYKTLQLWSYMVKEPLPIELAMVKTPMEIVSTIQTLILLRSNEEQKELMEAFAVAINGMEPTDISKILYCVRCMIFDISTDKNGGEFCDPLRTPISSWNERGTKVSYEMIQYFSPNDGQTISEAEYNRLPQDNKTLYEAIRYYVFADKDGQKITIKQDDLPYLEVLVKRDIEAHPEMIWHYLTNTGKDCRELPKGGATYMLRHTITDAMRSLSGLNPEFQEGGVLYNAVLAGAIKNPYQTGIATLLTLHSKVDKLTIGAQGDEKLDFYLNLIEQICLQCEKMPDDAVSGYRNGDGSFLPGVNEKGEIITTGSTSVGQKRAYLHQLGENLLQQIHGALQYRSDLWTNPTMMRLNQLCIAVFSQT